jgi:transcriptional regulator with XRE-family HTH domain
MAASNEPTNCGTIDMNEPIYRIIGAKIEQTRNVLGWTQLDLANKVGLTRGSIANIETGRQRILLHDVEKFATAFNTQPKVLLRGIWF